MTTTILIFIVLLSGYPSSELTAVRWDNTVLHYVMPIAVIRDWLTASQIMNPSVHGYLGVVITSAVIAIILAVIAGGIWAVARWSPLGVGRHPDLPPG